MSSIEDYRASNVDTAQVIEVIKVESLFGDGTKESVARRIVEYYDLEGHLLARVDAHAKSNLHLIDKTAPKAQLAQAKGGKNDE